MKKTAILALICALAGCTAQTETATESKTASIDTHGDELAAWIAEMEKSPDVLKHLNDIKSDAKDVQFSERCADPDVMAAMNARHFEQVIDDPDAAAAILRGIPDTGSEFVPKNLEKIESLSASIAKVPPAEPFKWLPEDAPALEKSLSKAGFSPDMPDAQKAFVKLLKSADCEKILPRYCAYADKTAHEQAVVLEQKAERDAYLVCDLTAWAGELRLNYPQNDYKFDRFRKYLSDKDIVSVRRQVFVEDMARRGVEKAFAAIEPPDPQYRALIAARKRYVDAIAAGGWPEVQAPKRIQPAKIGQSYPYVPALRTRLAAEGYEAGDVNSDVFDQTISDAVVLYREVHQLSPKKVIDSVLFKNMAVSPEKRLDTIDLAIQKYRELAIGSLHYYVKVNIPDFYVEVWRGGKREARNRIVVGNNKKQLDPITKKPVPDPETLYPIYPNRTPMQTSKINELIYNPYWNVPARIRIEELEPKLALNPNYYVENFYEEVNVDDPRLYYVRELPNPRNSLGKVKFMFPNPHNTYLHDTPAKAVFKNPVRGFSHGCMRVQNPLELAELLLRNDGQWDKQKVKEILDAEEPVQTSIMLKTPVDVDVVYVNARVDDSGVVAFLSDIYKYDAVRTGEYVEKKLPRPKDLKN